METVRDVIAKNILFYRKKLNLTQKELAEKLGVKNSAVSNWEKGQNSVDIEILFRICDILKIDVNTIFGVNNAESISNEDKNLISKYNELDSHGKEVINSTLDIEYKRIQELKAKAPTIIKPNFKDEFSTLDIPYLDMPASAGTGEYISKYECSELITVQETELTKKTDFVIRVNGDSMEPKFHDGDRVLVKCQPTVEIGEIGIFVVNGERYIKKQGNGCLISLNKKYPEIIPSEYDDVCCRGKVIGSLK